jgi:Family of unknown function (DUF6459)
MRPPQPRLPAPACPALPPVPARLALPAAGPPYDDQGPAGLGPGIPAAPAGLGGPDGGSGPDGSGPDGSGPDGSGPDGSGPDGSGPDGSGPDGSGPDGGPPGALVPASGWTSVFAQGLAEALAGSRPPRQIAPWTTEQARRRIRQIGPLLPSGPRPVVRRVLTSVPRRDVVEMTVIVGIGPLTRAIAVRLERVPADPGRPGRGRPWLCTVIEAA